MPSTVRISHWLPIVTLCPVNKLPDLIYVYLTFNAADFHELYAVRKQVRKLVTAKRLRFMEDIAQQLREEFPDAVSVEVRLLTGRHVVTLKQLDK